MEDDKKKYLCKLPTNGHQPGDIVELTAKEVENLNGGEDRFELAKDQAVETKRVEDPAAPGSTMQGGAEDQAPAQQ